MSKAIEVKTVKIARKKTVIVTDTCELISFRLCDFSITEGSLWEMLGNRCLICYKKFKMGDQPSIIVFRNPRASDQQSGAVHTECLQDQSGILEGRVEMTPYIYLLVKLHSAKVYMKLPEMVGMDRLFRWDINDSDVVYELKRNLGFCRDVWEVVADG